MFLRAKCWCLSYVFSAFGLFSYCLPGLFGSSTSQPVCGFFLPCLTVCPSRYRHFTFINLSFGLRLSCMCQIFSGWCVLLHSAAILWSLFLYTSILHSLLFVWMLLSLHLWPAFFRCFTGRSVWFKMCHFSFGSFKSVHPWCVFCLAMFWFLIFFDFFLPVLSCSMCGWLSPGLSGEHHEREDAKERRTLVVFMEEQEQRL